MNENHFTETAQWHIDVDGLKKAVSDINERLTVFEASDAFGKPTPAQRSAYSAPVSEVEERGTEEQIALLYGAIAGAAGEFKPVTRSRRVTIRNKEDTRNLYVFEYAPMEELIAATRPALSKYGLAVLMPFTTSATAECIQHVIVAHKDGGRLVYKFAFSPIMEDEKKFGGQTTYLQRYCYRSVLSLAADGDLDEQPTRAEEGAAQVGPRTQQAAPKTQPNRNPPPQQSASGAPAGQDSKPAGDQLRVDMLAAAKACSISGTRDFALFVYKVLSNNEPFALNDQGAPFASGLTQAQMEKVIGALVNLRAEQVK